MSHFLILDSKKFNLIIDTLLGIEVLRPVTYTFYHIFTLGTLSVCV
jgi:hypothetical protein